MSVLVQKDLPAANLLIRGATVCDPRVGLDSQQDVLVQSGEISAVGAVGSLSAPAGTDTIEGEGLHLFPGFVDIHVHLRSPGQEYKEDIASGTAAAAAGGFVAVIAMPNTDPVVDSVPILDGLRARAAEDALIPVGFTAAITKGLKGESLTEMGMLRDRGCIGFTDDGKPVQDAGIMRRAFQYQKVAGGVIALHEEDPQLSGEGVIHEGEVSAALGLAGIPSISESTFIARDAALAKYEGARIHIQHLSARESVEALAAAKAAGVDITGEVSPHHLTLTDVAVKESLDTNLKMNPPLRTEDDRQALIAGLIDGTIDFIATDHAPHAAHEKEVPLEEAAMGTIGLETAFAVVYTHLVQPGKMSLSLLVERLTAGAERFEIPVPKVQVGEPANLTVVDLNAEWEVGARGFKSKSQNCCFSGQRLNGKVHTTVAGGSIVYRADVMSSGEIDRKESVA